MANEKELQLEPVEEPKSKKKLIIIIVLAVLVVGGGVVAAILLLGGESSEPEPVAEVAEAEPVAITKGPAIYIKMKPEFIINYQVGPRQRYLQIYMEAMTRNPAIADAIEMHSPMIRSAIISLLSQQTFEFLRTPEGRSQVRDMVTEEVRRLVAQETGIEEGLEEVLFTNFVMQ